jgi:hypothetical protein
MNPGQGKEKRVQTGLYPCQRMLGFVRRMPVNYFMATVSDCFSVICSTL